MATNGAIREFLDTKNIEDEALITINFSDCGYLGCTLEIVPGVSGESILVSPVDEESCIQIANTIKSALQIQKDLADLIRSKETIADNAVQYAELMGQLETTDKNETADSEA